jgi:hypothetical protein
LTLQFRPDPDFDARWAAWVARGAEYDRQTRRRLAFLLPIVATFVLAAAYMSWTR